MNTEKPILRTRYSNTDGQFQTIIDPKEKSLTKQADAQDSDINNIMKKYLTTGELPNMIQQNPQYGDFSTVEDYRSSYEIVLRAQEQFEALDAHIRARFDNDPATFLEFATNAANAPEMLKMGLLTINEAKTAAAATQTASIPDQAVPAVGEKL